MLTLPPATNLAPLLTASATAGTILCYGGNTNVDLTVEMLGEVHSMPVGIAPTGFTRMMQTEGEIAGCTAARDAGIPYTLSTMGTRSIEDVERAAPDGRNAIGIAAATPQSSIHAFAKAPIIAGMRKIITHPHPVFAARCARKLANVLSNG